MSLLKHFLEWLFPGDRLCPENKRFGTIPSRSNLYNTTLHLAWPALTETVLVGLVGIVDTVMVSSCGTEAIDAVGIVTQPKFIVLALFMALNVGVTAVVARRIGEGRSEDARSILRQALVVCAGLLVIVTSLAFIFSRNILELAGATADYIDDADSYFRVILIGIPFTALSLVINAAHRGTGNTKISMVTNLTANGINIIFNYFLIGGNCGFPKLGVTGAAIATTLGYVVAFFISLWTVLRRHSPMHISFLHDSFRLHRNQLAPILFVGSSAAVEQLFMRFGFMTYAIIIAGLGTNDFAAHQICMTILSFSFTFGDGLSVAATTLVGQSMGQKRPDLALIYGKICQRIGLSIAVFISAIFFFGRYLITGFFTNVPYIVEYCALIFILMAAIVPFQMSQVILLGALRGAGDARYTAIISFIAIAIIRPGLSFLLCYPAGMGLFGAWLGLFADQLIRFFLSAYRYYRCKWFKIQL